MAANPFAQANADADAVFVRRIDDVTGLLNHVTIGPIRPEAQITTLMRELRVADLETRRQAYESHRIVDQQSWYAAKAESNRRASARWSQLSIVLEFSAVGTALASIAGYQLLGFTGVFATAIVAAAGWLQAKQHDSLSHAYGVAATELANIRSLIRSPTSEESWSQFVEDAEEAISREHTLWRASRGVGRALTSGV